MAKAMFANGGCWYEFKVNGITRPDIVEAWQVEMPSYSTSDPRLYCDRHYWKARDFMGRDMEFNGRDFEVIAHKQVK